MSGEVDDAKALADVFGAHDVGLSCGIGLVCSEPDHLAEAVLASRWLADLLAATRADAWEEGREAERADRVLLDVYPDLGRKINPYRNPAASPTRGRSPLLREEKN